MLPRAISYRYMARFIRLQVRNSELWGYLFSMLFGATLNAILIASLTAVIADLHASERAFRSKMDMVRPPSHGRYMRRYTAVTCNVTWPLHRPLHDGLGARPVAAPSRSFVHSFAIARHRSPSLAIARHRSPATPPPRHPPSQLPGQIPFQ